jgi:hypothetical protein
VRDTTPQTSPNASAAAMARTRHRVGGATRSQQPGTARRTIDGAKLKNTAVTGPAPTCPSGAARAAKYPAQKPRRPVSRSAVRLVGEK